MEIGKIIKKYRDEHQLTMQQFADRASLSKGYISMLEKGKHPQNNRPIIPSIETVQKLAAAMNVSVDYLLEQCGSDQLIEVPASSSASDQTYYLDPAAAQLAQELFERPEMRVLFDASRNASKEDIEQVASILEKMSGGASDD